MERQSCKLGADIREAAFRRPTEASVHTAPRRWTHSPSRATGVVMIGEGQLKTMLAPGRVTPRSIRLWARDAEGGDYAIEILHEGESVRRVEIDLTNEASDHTGAWTYPDDFSGERDLDPNTAYTAHLVRGDERIASARFSTAPEDTPSHFTFGAFSCHQPFSEDAEIYEGVPGMLAASHKALVEAEARFCLLMGDQIYADFPESQSLFDEDYFAEIAPPGRKNILECTREEVRAIYQERHRRFWSVDAFREIQSDFPCYLILDDHEVVDNFGTHPDHATPEWENLRQGALDAYYDYQGSRAVLPAPDGGRPRELYFSFGYGCLAGFVMDIRSERRTADEKTTPYSEKQLDAFKAFLEDNTRARVLLILTSVPLVHLEAWAAKLAGNLMAKGSDVHERWSHPSCSEHRDELMRLIHGHAMRNPHQTIALLGGDIHTGAAFRLSFPSGIRLYQLTSSAISNREGKFRSKVFELAPKAVSSVDFGDGLEAKVELIKGSDEDSAHNPFGGLNIGLIEVEDDGREAKLRFRLIADEPEADGRPRTVFASVPLGRCLP